MTNMETSKELAEQLRRAATAAEIYRIINAIAARRRTVKERLASIEDRNGTARRAAIESADSDVLARLNREAESLDDELGFLSHLDSRAFPLHLAATEQETVENGKRAHRRITQVTAAAEEALAAYSAARQRLEEATSAIGGANDQLRGERMIVDDATVERIMLAMWPVFLVREEQRRGARSGLRQRICAPAPPVYGDSPPDMAAQVRDIMSPFARRDRGAG